MKTKRCRRVKRRHWCQLIGLDSLCQKTSIITKKRTVLPWDAFEDIAFKPRVWNGQIINQVVASQLLSSLWNMYHRWRSDIELNQISVFSASYSRIKPGFTCGKRICVSNRHASYGHKKATFLKSIVYVHACWRKTQQIIPSAYMMDLHAQRLKQDLLMVDFEATAIFPSRQTYHLDFGVYSCALRTV
jgi:hypothetical protein